MDHWADPLPSGWSKSSEVTYEGAACGSSNRLQFDDITNLFIQYEIPSGSLIDSVTFAYHNDDYTGTIQCQSRIGTTWTTLHTYIGDDDGPACVSAITVAVPVLADAIRWIQTVRDLNDFGSLLPTILMEEAPLPIGLMEFSGQHLSDKVVLSWKTASEQNNRGFDIERSNDGKNWEMIGFKSSLAIDGYSSTQLQYMFTDPAPLPVMVNFYRIKQVDFTGEYSYSNIVRIESLQHQSSNLNINIYPNPAKDNIKISGIQAGQKVQIFDMMGRRFYEQVIDENDAEVNLSNYSPGTYMVIVTDEKRSNIARFRVVKT